MSSIAKDIIIVVAGVAIIWFGLRIAFGTDNPFYVVSSGSMEPNLNVFDVLVVQGNDPFKDLKKGDIIVFNRPSGHDRVIVHRVAEVIDEDPRVIRTKGDANPASIPGTDFPITEEEYIGKVAYVIPQIGYVTRILTPPINYIIIAVIVGIMILKQYGKRKGSLDSASNELPKDQPPTDAYTNPPSPGITSDEIKQMQDDEYTKTDSVKEVLETKEPEQKQD